MQHKRNTYATEARHKRDTLPARANEGFRFDSYVLLPILRRSKTPKIFISEYDMKELVPQEFPQLVETKIFLLRGQKVMLGPHLAELYGVETRALMQAVNRNGERFPEDFMFQLTREEIMRISQSVTSLKYSKAVYAFTEQGVAMLSGILNSPRAIQANIAIMRAFVKLRELISTHKELAQKLNELERRVERHDEELHAIFDAIRRLMQTPEKPKRRIGFGVEEPKAKYSARRRG
jgi:hypothetical protein